MDTWILRMLRRKYTRQLVAWAAATTLGVFAAFGTMRYLVNFARGPFPMSASDLDRVGDVTRAPRYFVRVSPDKTMETGLQEETVETQSGVEISRHVSAAYYVVALGDKLLIVKSVHRPLSVTDGSLELMTDDLENNLFDTAEKRAARGRFYPFYLDAATAFRSGGYWAIAGALAFLALLVWRWRIAWHHLHDIESHPVARRVAGWGNAVTTAVEIERELERPDRRAWGAWTLTANYLVHRSLFGFDVLRFHDLLWAYKKVTQKRVNLIPAGKSYSALLYCYGGTAELRGSQKNVDELLQGLVRRTPWAVVGYSKERQDLWSKKNKEFCAGVEERRRVTDRGPQG